MPKEPKKKDSEPEPGEIICDETECESALYGWQNDNFEVNKAILDKQSEQIIRQAV